METPELLPPAPIQELVLSPVDIRVMRDEADRLAPEEACGIIIGETLGSMAVAVKTIPVTNSLHSNYRYLMDPLEQLRVMQEIEEVELALVGIYHSHPQGPSQPSATDIGEAYYPEAVHLIWSHRLGAWECHGFLILDGEVHPVKLTIKDGDQDSAQGY